MCPGIFLANGVFVTPEQDSTAWQLKWVTSSKSYFGEVSLVRTRYQKPSKWLVIARENWLIVLSN
tara:strand:+ start:546 stop:740 length:195 start_codon:yes stop_codon:yes gene_type:complete